MVLILLGSKLIKEDARWNEYYKYYIQKNISNWITFENNQPAAQHKGGVWDCQVQNVRTILDALLKTHSRSLNDEHFRALLAETEEIVNFRRFTVETLWW